MNVSRLQLTMLATTLALLAITAPAGAAGGDRGLFGVVTQDRLGERDFDRMDAGGVASLRFILRWSAVQPAPGAYDFSSIDPVVASAAARGVEPFPVVYGTPPWLTDDERRPPLDTPAGRDAWRALLTALAERYGHGGSFWVHHDGRPIRRWQIWNEPNFDLYWHPRPSAPEYGRLVELSSEALRAADPRARTVLAGVAAVRSGVRWWSFLRDLYDRKGIRRSFDAVALHPYAPGIRLLGDQVALARRIMARNGDRTTPLAITEVGWASGGDPAPLVVGADAQARLLGRAFRLLERRRREWRISDVQWYAWQDSNAIEPFCSFCRRAGLFDFQGDAKPAWRAFRRAAR